MPITRRRIPYRWRFVSSKEELEILVLVLPEVATSITEGSRSPFDLSVVRFPDGRVWPFGLLRSGTVTWSRVLGCDVFACDPYLSCEVVAPSRSSYEFLNLIGCSYNLRRKIRFRCRGGRGRRITIVACGWKLRLVVSVGKVLVC